MSKFGMSRMSASKATKQRPSAPKISVANPFDSDSDTELSGASKTTQKPIDPPIRKSHTKPESFSSNNEEVEKSGSSSSSLPSHSGFSGGQNRYKNDFRDSGGLESQSVQELENYAGYKAEETTKQFNNCLKITEEIREDATKTLITLHQQGEQIKKTHEAAANMDHDLSRGEKLLGSLGGIFSKTWKPKKSRDITGPVISRDNSFQRRGNQFKQRERLGLHTSSRGKKSNSRAYSNQINTSTLEKIEIEKSKQDDALTDLSNMLGELKGMAVDMGSEIESQNKVLDPFFDDVDEVSSRIKGANLRARRLLGK